MSAAPLIVLRGLTKTYGQGDAAFQALKGIDLTIHKGEFVAIMGPSGSGKSTLMNVLGCLDTPTTGSYQYEGIAVEKLGADQRSLLRRYALGFIFHTPHGATSHPLRSICIALPVSNDSLNKWLNIVLFPSCCSPPNSTSSGQTSVPLFIPTLYASLACLPSFSSR